MLAKHLVIKKTIGFIHIALVKEKKSMASTYTESKGEHVSDLGLTMITFLTYSVQVSFLEPILRSRMDYNSLSEVIDTIPNDATQRQSYNNMFQYLTRYNGIMNKNGLQTEHLIEKLLIMQSFN